ncbi:ATP-binding cassette domain-containing protein [Ensifer sp. ENS05]|uniref:ABC transporter ATP-binding protein n=1 Tax=Ensifer sp. ENS05 TaxID=2769277 RepID=UPI001785AE84|nr:ATP-binding cassette domain-containing protein [Ensifer sp. ENS05]MBD9596625.1 ATP-binding cassette domain-containing protein [Ensifer sp. ENS05]
MSALQAHVRESDGGLPISLSLVEKSFGQLNVLDSFNLEVPAGQFLAVVGRSGGGKSTLLRLIAGLDAATAGRVSIAGQKVDRTLASVRLLFQEARLVPWQRVIENVGIARGQNWQETARRALADVGLGGRENDWPSVLSGGQRQRVALARALVSAPQILLLDEPFGALDALTRIEMHRLLEGIWTGRGFTTVLITHDVAEAVALADRVVVLREGAIALDIDIDLERPRRELADPRAVDLQRQILEAV